MRSIPLAFSWVLWRQGSWRLLGAFLAANLVPLLLFMALQREGGIDPSHSSIIILQLVLVQVGVFSVGLVAIGSQEPISRLATYPIPLTTLVTWQMLPAMAVVFGHTVLSVALLNRLFGLGWPLWGPALAMSVMTAGVQAALWVFHRSAWLPVGIAVVGALMGSWIKMRYGPFADLPEHYWRIVRPTEVATMLAMLAASYGIGVLALSRIRRGDPPGSLGILAWLDRVLTPRPYCGPGFLSAEQAQTWFEWRSRGWFMPVASLCLLTVYLLGWLIFSRDVTEWVHVAAQSGVILSLIGLMCGFVLGQRTSKDNHPEMGPFLATRPLSTSGMTRVLLKVAVLSVATSWLIWFSGFLIVLAGVRLVNGTLRLPPEPIAWGWCLAASLLGPWVAMSLGMSAGLAGRNKLFAQLFCGGLAAFFLGLVLSNWLFTRETQVWTMRILVAVAVGTVFTGTVAMFWRAWRKGLINTSTVFAASATAMVVLGLLVVSGNVSSQAEPWAIGAVMLGAASAAVVVVAAAPLALQWNRIR